MGDILKTIGGIAAAVIPGAAPIVGAVSTIFPGLFGGGGSAATASQPVTAGGTPMGVLNGGTDTGSAVAPLEAPHLYGGPSPYTPATIPGTTLPSTILGLPIPAPFMQAATSVAGAVSGFIGGGGLSAVPVVGGLVRALPTIERVVPGWILRTAGYAALGVAIYEEYKAWRASGASHKTARRRALARAGVHLRRRRMRATNIHALRRAIRRIHSFKRVAGKVGALGVGRRRLLAAPHRRRRIYRRGDVDPFLVEDYVDMMDEAEDAGLEPDKFQEVYE